MFAKGALISAMALALGLVTTPGVAFAGLDDNANAWVSGVQGEPSDGSECPEGYFCLYTKIYGYQGKVFKLYYCREYDLHNWNGNGAFVNNNTGGAHALLQGRDYATLVDSSPDSADGLRYQGIFDFSPIWHVKAC